MTYVITESCIDIKDRSCVEECPVDCIYEGGRKLYINPDECIDCGACAPACPMDAIVPASELAGGSDQFTGDNRAFFTETLPGRDGPLGNPGGSAEVGPVDGDTELVRNWGS
jgi:NAD-dependent dihydropyrimidine dehydrogenase PreA subunit